MNALVALEVAALVPAFVCAASLTYWAAGAAMPTGVRTGVRGLVRQRTLERGGAYARLEPLVRWIGQRVHGLLSPQLRGSLDRQVVMAGSYLGLLAEELVALGLLGSAAGLVAGGLANLVVKVGPMLVVAVGVFGGLAPFLTVSSHASERSKAIGRRLPSAVDLLALSMSAGLDFPNALRQVVEKSGTPNDPLIEELTLVLQSLSLGRTRRQALEELAERAPLDAVNEFVGSVVQAELRGNPLAEVLRIQAEVSRQRRTVAAEEAAAKAGVSMIMPLVLVFLAILILIVGPMAIRLSQSGI
ncbi:MAG: Type secretion system protein TadC, associated with Flp pilus assembly [Labilithrix sp.]|nr:Type secretion system protein TadC, associated with Flp pilus assembly [Labilithrix sp.]